jgi:transglutaminase/protease-like cytokinesis protein 3
MNMSTTSIETSAKSKRPARSKPCDAVQASPRAKTKPASVTAPTVSKTTTPPIDGRVTKQERVLTLLSRSEGASIEEMMQATDWQQHSVRGFLAGTVKKKLGFTLTSSKAEGDVRRYRIETKRGR